MDKAITKEIKEVRQEEKGKKIHESYKNGDWAWKSNL